MQVAHGYRDLIPNKPLIAHLAVEIERNRGKGNYSPPTKAAWVRFVDAELPNGDDVGVIVPWTHPGQSGKPSEVMVENEKRAEALFLQLLAKYREAGRPVSPAVNSSYYAPKMFAAEKETKTAKLGRAHLSAAMQRLFDAGRIRTATEAAPNRHGRETIVTASAAR